MQLRKTIITACFFLTFFFSQFGYHIIYNIQQHHLKEIAKEKIITGIPDEMLTAIDITADAKNIRWKEEGKELCMNGNLYDVAKKKKLGGRTIILCFNDRDERKLLKEFTRTGSEQNADGKNSKQIVKLQLTDLMITTKKNWPINQDISTDYFSFNDNIVSAITEVKSPPPKA